MLAEFSVNNSKCFFRSPLNSWHDNLSNCSVIPNISILSDNSSLKFTAFVIKPSYVSISLFTQEAFHCIERSGKEDFMEGCVHSFISWQGKCADSFLLDVSMFSPDKFDFFIPFVERFWNSTMTVSWENFVPDGKEVSLKSALSRLSVVNLDLAMTWEWSLVAKTWFFCEESELWTCPSYFAITYSYSNFIHCGSQLLPFALVINRMSG